MADRRGEAILLAVICFAGIGGLYIARKQLHDVQTSTRITQEEKTPEIISQHTEDAIKIDTLRDLADGPNFEIRQAAIKIVVERVARKETYDLLLRNIASNNTKERDKCLASLRYLCTSSVSKVACSYNTYKVLIDCITTFLKQNESRLHQPDTDFKERTQAERDIFQILSITVPSNVKEALLAGLVTQWLSKYPFGGAKSPENTKLEIVQRLKKGETDDSAMYSILSHVHQHPLGWKQLRTYGLIGNAMNESADDYGDSYRPNVDIFNDDIVHYSSPGTFAPRIREEGPEEQARRRRRREAMVIIDGTQPLGRDNIIQRRRTGDDLD